MAPDELYGQPASGVRRTHAGCVLRQPRTKAARAAYVEGSVGTLEDVGEGHDSGSGLSRARATEKLWPVDSGVVSTGSTTETGLDRRTGRLEPVGRVCGLDIDHRSARPRCVVSTGSTSRTAGLDHRECVVSTGSTTGTSGLDHRAGARPRVCGLDRLDHRSGLDHRDARSDSRPPNRARPPRGVWSRQARPPKGARPPNWRESQLKTTVRWPLSSTRDSECQRTARESTCASTSRPAATSWSWVCPWSTRITPCSMIGPSSSSAVT